jgi:hypothetical protein
MCALITPYLNVTCKGLHIQTKCKFNKGSDPLTLFGSELGIYPFLSSLIARPVRKYLEQLVEIDLLIKFKLGKENYYLNKQLFNLLSE